VCVSKPSFKFEANIQLYINSSNTRAPLDDFQHDYLYKRNRKLKLDYVQSKIKNYIK